MISLVGPVVVGAGGGDGFLRGDEFSTCDQQALTLSCLGSLASRSQPELCALPSLYGSVRPPAGAYPAGEGTGQSGCRDLNGTGLADLIPDWDVFKRAKTRTAIGVSLVMALWWACQDLNLGPHPYQQSRAKRCADRPFSRSPPSVKGEGMRSNPAPPERPIKLDTGSASGGALV